MFPCKEKYETEITNEANPVFNQEFTFSLDRATLLTLKKNDDIFKGKFIVLTVYAVLDTDKGNKQLRRSNSLRDRFRNLLNLNEETSRSSSVRARPRSLNTISFNNRRNIGAVTYNLEKKYFTLKLKNNYYSTPDIWRCIHTISSGVQMESVRN